jgi:hypothetical protein
MGASNTPTPTVMVTSTNLPTSTPLENTPTQLSPPTEDLPTSTPTPANTPTSTPVVVPPASDAVFYYYSQVSADNFEITWSLLSDHYKATVNKTGFIPYRDYWASVDKVIVNNLSTVYDDGKTATIIADLVYYYHDGRVISIDQSEFGMIYDTQRQTWLINATP